MSQPYVGQILMFAGNFAPAGWMTCSGQLLPISEYDTLFNLIGTTYGGDGQSTFGLPDLQGRVPIHMGQGGGFSNYSIGQFAGTESVSLNSNQLPSHNHLLATVNAPGNQNTPSVSVVLANEQSGVGGTTEPFAYLPFSGANQVQLSTSSIGSSGTGVAHENRQPVLAVTYCISLFGIFPSPN